MHYVYMIKNIKGNLYIGITQGPEQRIEHHNTKRGANFTKSSSSFSIIFLEEYPNIIEACKREIQLKKWSRVKKEKLIEMYYKNINTKL